MATKSTTRAPRKTNVVKAVEAVEAVVSEDVSTPPEGAWVKYCRNMNVAHDVDASPTRWFVALVSGVAAQLGAGFIVGSLVTSIIALPTLSGIIWFAGFLACVLAIAIASITVGNFVMNAIVSKYDVTAYKAIRGLFNPRKEVTA